MTNKTKAEIIAHSKRANTGEEIITYKLTFPRIILSEVNTYKMLEKNTSSSRAIPFEKMIEVVKNEPFVPIAFQWQHKGMQGTEYFTDAVKIAELQSQWLNARNRAVEEAIELHKMGATKQLTNRLLEPFMWVTQLITGTRESFEHLFEQRCPIYELEVCPDSVVYATSKKEFIKKFDCFKDKDDLWWLQNNKGQAEIHFMDLAEKMYDALNESVPVVMNDGDWHIPFEDTIRNNFKDINAEDIIKMSVCLTAKVSYTKIGDENTISIEQSREMYERLKNSGHWSCFGHAAKCMTDKEYIIWVKGKIEREDYIVAIPQETHGYNKNLRGFISLRQYAEDNYGIIIIC